MVNNFGHVLFTSHICPRFVIPAKARIRIDNELMTDKWIPAFAGMTNPVGQTQSRIISKLDKYS